jgi:hypothetical protein
MENLPTYIAVVFIITTALTVYLFQKAANYSRTSFLIICAWLLITGVIALTGFFTVTNTLPPRFALLVAPPFLLVLFLFLSRRGRAFIDKLDLRYITLLHTVRLPVEIVLMWLAVHKAVPDLMTFEGRNFDILSGISAPLIWYFGFVRKKIGPRVILAWNFICLALLLNIVVHAILSAPTPFQQMAFEQPNIGVFYFPFVWLPGIVVPLVLLSHLAAIRKLLKAKVVPVPLRH